MAQQTYDLGPVCPIYKGDWSAKATYETLNMVRHGTALWVMTAKAYTVGSTPSDSSTFWKKAAQDGAAGAKGATGAKGASLVVKGAWASGTAYVNNTTQIDVVTYNGSSYACKKSHTSSSSILPTNATYWTLIAQKGATGATGKQGEKGDKGDKGDTGATGPQGPAGPQATTLSNMKEINGSSLVVKNGGSSSSGRAELRFTGTSEQLPTILHLQQFT